MNTADHSLNFFPALYVFQLGRAVATFEEWHKHIDEPFMFEGSLYYHKQAESQIWKDQFWLQLFSRFMDLDEAVHKLRQMTPNSAEQESLSALATASENILKDLEARASEEDLLYRPAKGLEPFTTLNLPVPYWMQVARRISDLQHVIQKLQTLCNAEQDLKLLNEFAEKLGEMSPQIRNYWFPPEPSSKTIGPKKIKEKNAEPNWSNDLALRDSVDDLRQNGFLQDNFDEVQIKLKRRLMEPILPLNEQIDNLALQLNDRYRCFYELAKFLATPKSSPQTSDGAEYDSSFATLSKFRSIVESCIPTVPSLNFLMTIEFDELEQPDEYPKIQKEVLRELAKSPLAIKVPKLPELHPYGPKIPEKITAELMNFLEEKPPLKIFDSPVDVKGAAKKLLYHLLMEPDNLTVVSHLKFLKVNKPSTSQKNAVRKNFRRLSDKIASVFKLPPEKPVIISYGHKSASRKLNIDLLKHEAEELLKAKAQEELTQYSIFRKQSVHSD